jgi:hypothetical protein
MSAAAIIALIALAGSVISSAIAVFGASAVQSRSAAKRRLDDYREPLLAACYELQARLYNIVRLSFIEKYVIGEQAGKRDAAVDTTLYVFAQYFGWYEILRREVQYLRFPRNSQTKKTALFLRNIEEAFLSDSFGNQCMIWRVEQRGLGERMIEYNDHKAFCMGYASFRAQRASMEEWLDDLERDLTSLDDGGRERLTVLQHLLLDAVRQLDTKDRRYPFDMRKA